MNDLVLGSSPSRTISECSYDFPSSSASTSSTSASSSSADRRVKLDVGGKIFSTTLSTLTRLSDNFFSAMFSGRFPLKLQDDGSLFIDRDAAVFPLVLNFLRGQILNVESMTPAERTALKDDAEFYQITELMELLAEPKFVAEFVAGKNYTLNTENDTVTHSGTKSWDCIILGHELPKELAVFRFRYHVVNGDFNSHILLGVAPSTLNRETETVFSQAGWYFYCHNSTLYSGPPQNKCNFVYGPSGKISSGAVVDVEVDRRQQTISFVIDGQSRGVAYAGVFTQDADLCPCVAISSPWAAVRIAAISQW